MNASFLIASCSLVVGFCFGFMAAAILMIGKRADHHDEHEDFPGC